MSAERGTVSRGKESLFFNCSFQPINHPGGRGSRAQSLGFLQALLRAAGEVSHSPLPNNESLFSPLLPPLPAAPAAFHVWGVEQPKPGELLGVLMGWIQHPVAGWHTALGMEQGVPPCRCAMCTDSWALVSCRLCFPNGRCKARQMCDSLPLCSPLSLWDGPRDVPGDAFAVCRTPHSAQSERTKRKRVCFIFPEHSVSLCILSSGLHSLKAKSRAEDRGWPYTMLPTPAEWLPRDPLCPPVPSMGLSDGHPPCQ